MFGWHCVATHRSVDLNQKSKDGSGADAQEIGTKWLGPEHQAALHVCFTDVGVSHHVQVCSGCASRSSRVGISRGDTSCVLCITNLYTDTCNLALEQAQHFCHHQMQVKRPHWSIEALCQVVHTHRKLFCEVMHDQNVNNEFNCMDRISCI